MTRQAAGAPPSPNVSANNLMVCGGFQKVLPGAPACAEGPQGCPEGPGGESLRGPGSPASHLSQPEHLCPGLLYLELPVSFHLKKDAEHIWKLLEYGRGFTRSQQGGR